TTNFILLALLTFFLKGRWHFRQIIRTLLVLVWGLHLSSFLLRRIVKRLNPCFQALWVWTIALHTPGADINVSRSSEKLTFM
ncbi:hypothetical protein HPP92_011081, partial [Vanilla planifolia]